MKLKIYKWLTNTVVASISFIGLTAIVQAAPVTLSFTTTIGDVSGSYVGELSIGQTIMGSFTFDIDEANADPGAITVPSVVPGHEFSSFYEFSGAPYDVSLSVPTSFTNTAPVGVVVNDNLTLTADDTGGLLPAGNYDWVEILGSSTTSVCLLPGGVCAADEYSPANGEEWTLALFGDTNWFSDGSVIPDSLPSSYTAILVGFEFDVDGLETGAVFANVGTVNVSSVPVPAAVWLFGSGLIGLFGLARRKKA